MTPLSAALTASQSQQFTATVKGSSNQAVTWTRSPAVGTISAAGLYTAPATIAVAQAVTVKATSVADSTKSVSATVTLNPQGPPTNIFVIVLGTTWPASHPASSGSPSISSIETKPKIVSLSTPWANIHKSMPWGAL